MIMITYLTGCLVSAILLFIFYWKYSKQYKVSDVPISVIMILLSWAAIIVEVVFAFCMCMDYVDKHWTKVLWKSKNKE